jgi:hypothetical protein
MLAAHDNTVDYIRNKSFLTSDRSTIQFTSKRMLSAYDNIEDHIKNGYFL